VSVDALKAPSNSESGWFCGEVYVAPEKPEDFTAPYSRSQRKGDGSTEAVLACGVQYLFDFGDGQGSDLALGWAWWSDNLADISGDEAPLQGNFERATQD
jgi:hypothetical protein